MAQSAPAGRKGSADARAKRPAKPRKKSAGKAKPGAAGKPARQPFPIVGVGASAGGLEAFTALLKALPPDTGMAFVLVQHMDPTHESMLVPLLARATEMPVNQVKDGMAVGPDRVYVIPPNTTMSIHRGVLRLVSRHKAGDGHMPINDFLESLAADRHSGAIGVILSGTASDGTLGLKAIKAEGGITFAQDEHTAAYPGMPQSAINAGFVDFVMPPSQIAAELTRIKQLPYFGKEQVSAAEEPEELSSAEPHLEKIFSLLHGSTGVDFRLYKRGTIRRRIQRRMALSKTEDLDQYVRFLEKNPKEVDALFDDILIHVTGFFREPEAFQTLKTAVFPRIRARLAPGDAIRIWVAGCSSGEEVYSIAMALLEFLGHAAPHPRIQIFGTDISERDIDKSRTGIYSESSVANITRTRLRRFFVKLGDNYQIVKSVREMCVFARHDLAADPPFSKLDLITCRNLLIYMSQPLQKRMIALFHYALNPDGYLLLGKSEAISGYSNLFAATDHKSNLYIRREAPVSRTFEMASKAYERSLTDRVADPASVIPFNARKEGERIMLERFAPPGFYIDAELNIVHFQGDTSPFLRPANGEASFQLLKIVRPEL